MKAVVRLLASFAMVCLVAAAASAQGVQISSRTTGMGPTPTTTVTQIDRNRMRTEITDPSVGQTIIIFDGTRNVLQLITVARKTYMEITKAQVDQMAGQMQGMMSQMEAAMANMPPAQRAQMEALMRGRGAASMVPARPEYRKTGTDRVGKWACDKYEGVTNGQKVSDICTVDPGALGFAPADLAVLKQMSEFAKSLTSMVPGASNAVAGVAGEGMPGVPVRTVTTVGGNVTTSEITDVSRQTFAEASFQVPAGFTKQEMPTMGGRGRQ
jgi:hypothetical protein